MWRGYLVGILDFVRRGAQRPPLAFFGGMSSDGAKRNAASATTNVITDDDMLKLILDNAGLLACRHARVSKQWKRAAEAVKLSGQTLESEPHVSCGGVWSRLDAGNDDHYLHDGLSLIHI